MLRERAPHPPSRTGVASRSIPKADPLYRRLLRLPRELPRTPDVRDDGLVPPPRRSPPGPRAGPATVEPHGA